MAGRSCDRGHSENMVWPCPRGARIPWVFTQPGSIAGPRLFAGVDRDPPNRRRVRSWAILRHASGRCSRRGQSAGSRHRGVSQRPTPLIPRAASRTRRHGRAPGPRLHTRIAGLAALGASRSELRASSSGFLAEGSDALSVLKKSVATNPELSATGSSRPAGNISIPVVDRKRCSGPTPSSPFNPGCYSPKGLASIPPSRPPEMAPILLWRRRRWQRTMSGFRGISGVKGHSVPPLSIDKQSPRPETLRPPRSSSKSKTSGDPVKTARPRASPLPPDTSL